MRISLLVLLLFAACSNVVLSRQIDSNITDTVKISTYLEKAKAFSKVAAFDSAVFYYTSARNLYLISGDTANSLNCDYRITKQISVLKDDTEALNFLIEEGKKYQNWLRDHSLYEAEYHYQIGEKYTDNQKFDSAVISYHRSLPLWLRNGKDSVIQIKNVYKAICYAYSQTGQFDSIIFYDQKSLAVYSAKYGFQNKVAVNSYLGIGNAYFNKGEFDKGIYYFHKALKTNLGLPNVFESDLAWTYNSLGISYYVKKDYNIALVYIRKALELFLKIYGEQSMETAWCYNNIGICYQEMKNDEEAYKYQTRALKIRLAVLGENHPHVAASYNNLGVICEDKKDYKNELVFFKKALEIRKRLFDESNQDVGLTYYNIGSTFMLLHQYDSSLYYYDRALSVFLNHHKESTGYISEIYVHKSRINLSVGNYSLAFENIRKSVATLVPSFTSTNISDNPEIDEISNYPEMIMALENKAKALQILYNNKSKNPDDLDKCLSVYRLISDINDRFSHQLSDEGARLFAESDAREIFGEAVKVAYRLSVIKNDRVYEESAFYFAEKARASVLADAMEEISVRHFADLPDSLLAIEKKVREDKAECGIKILELKQSGNADSVKLKTLENKYFSLTSQYQQITDSFRIKFPVYQYLLNVPKTITTDDIIAGLDSKTSLLEYLIVGDSLYIFSFNHNSFRIKAMPADSSIKQTIHQYPRDIRRLNTAVFAETSSLLFKTLILPVKEMFKDRERLIIIPDGELFYIPFETLVTDERNPGQEFSGLNYLIKQYDISYHYSATLWSRSKSHLSGKTKHGEGFIGFAPVFKSNQKEGNIITSDLILCDSLKGETALRSATSGARKFDELNYTEKEISSIVKLFAGKKLLAKGFLYSEATEDNFKKQAGKYKFVHIASHGFCDDKEPNLSGIAFYQTRADSSLPEDLPKEINENNDGILFSGETYNLLLNADLVVLSACESGTGRLMKGEGMMGLSRGFLFAGTPNIIYSLWKIGDLNTSQLMIDFYNFVLQKNSYAHSLRLAKLNLLNSEATAFPKFWSSFELVGE